MNLLSKLWASVKNATEAFQGLADTANEANGRMRAKLGLDEIDEPAEVEHTNGRKRVAMK